MLFVTIIITSDLIVLTLVIIVAILLLLILLLSLGLHRLVDEVPTLRALVGDDLRLGAPKEGPPYCRHPL